MTHDPRVGGAGRENQSRPWVDRFPEVSVLRDPLIAQALVVLNQVVLITVRIQAHCGGTAGTGQILDRENQLGTYPSPAAVVPHAEPVEPRVGPVASTRPADADSTDDDAMAFRDDQRLLAAGGGMKSYQCSIA